MKQLKPSKMTKNNQCKNLTCLRFLNTGQYLVQDERCQLKNKKLDL